MRLRSLTAIAGLVGGLSVYALATMLLAEWLPRSWPLQTAFFAIAGIVWIVPAARLVRWGVGKRPPSSG